jgi:rubrerythrin
VTYPVRDLEAVLLENAREGCIHETYAALIAAHQARYAEDPEVREVFTTIAAEEQRHAELAWDLHAWASERDPRMAARLRDALEDALATLAALVEARIPRPWDAAVGEPAPARVHALVDALGDALAPLAAA